MPGGTDRRPRPDVSPFRFEGPVEPADLIGRATEVAQVAGYARAGRAMSLAAPRRYGKTSLLRAVGDLLAADGFVVARVDLLGLDGSADFATRFATAWRRATQADRGLRAGVMRALAGLSQLGVTVAGSGVQVAFSRDTDPGSVLHALLDLPRQTERRVLLVFDEFQALHPVWPQGEGVLRGHVQDQLGRVAFVFAGSQPHLLEAAFADHGRAFYQQVLRVPLGRLHDDDLAGALTARFAESGRQPDVALPRLLRLAAGHPQRAMLLAHLLWEQLAPGSTADEDSWARVVERARSWTADEMAAVWTALTTAQQAALRAVHRLGSATVAEAVRPHAGRATLQHAQEALLRGGVIELEERTGPRGGRRFRLVDPLLGDWIDARSPTR
jgi:hypothetical protein